MPVDGRDPEDLEPVPRFAFPMVIKIGVVGGLYLLVVALMVSYSVPAARVALHNLLSPMEEYNETESDDVQVPIRIFMDDFDKDSDHWYHLEGLNTTRREIAIKDGCICLSIYNAIGVVNPAKGLVRVFLNDYNLGRGHRWQNVCLEIRARCSETWRGFVLLGFLDSDMNLIPPQNGLFFLSESEECDDPGTFAISEINDTKFLRKYVMGTDMSDWHNYSILWEPDNATFLIDGEVLASTEIEPSMPLAIVIHMENWDGNKTYLDIEEDQFIEIDYVRVFMDRDFYEEYCEKTVELLNQSLEQIESAANFGLNTSHLLSDHLALVEEFDAEGYVHAGRFDAFEDFVSHVDELVGLFDDASEVIPTIVEDRDRDMVEGLYRGAEDAWLKCDYRMAKDCLRRIIEKGSG